MLKIKLICAVSQNNVIGKNNQLPWRIKDEMRYFKEITIGNAVVMGFHTFESLDFNPLDDRLNIILTSKDHLKSNSDKQTFFVNNIEDVILIARSQNVENLFVIGGKQIYDLFLTKKLVDEIYYSMIKKDYDGDTTMGEIDWNTYRLKSLQKTELVDYYIYTNSKRPSGENQYLDILRNILTNHSDTLSCFGANPVMNFDLQNDGFPLLTTKKVFFRGVVHELLWFLNGKTDNKLLQKHNVKIWNENTTREYLDSRGLHHLEEGDGGAIYGHQFRFCGADYINCKTNYDGQGVDQIKYVIDLLKKEPNTRRAVISLWNPNQLKDMCLPPCHVLYQFRVVNDNRLDCFLFQRSGDLFLGVPFNIASASLFTHIISFLTGYTPGTLHHVISDAHIYKEHLNAVKEQLQNKVYPFPVLRIMNRKQQSVEDFMYDDFTLIGYRHNPKIESPIVVNN